MIPIGIRQFAEFMTESATTQRRILRELKYPKEESKAKFRAPYYQPALKAIIEHHRKGGTVSDLLFEVSKLARDASLEEGRAKAKLNNNSKMIRAYARKFGGRSFDLMPEVKLALLFGNVRISVIPNLHVEEKKREKLIKLIYGTKKPKPEFFKIISQVMFEAQEQRKMNLKSADVLCFDLIGGEAIKGARVGARMRRDIESTCRTIEDIWEKL